MEANTFGEIEEEFMARVRRIVWCTVATVDRQGRPRTRILHPIWEGSTGWIGTIPTSLKAKHLEKNPYVSLSYWDPQHEQVHVDASTEFVDDIATKRRIWNLFKNTPPPLGYDPAISWPGGPTDPEFGLLKLTPWRIELFGLAKMRAGGTIWRPS